VPTPTVRLAPSTAELIAGFETIRAEHQIPDSFPAEVDKAARSTRMPATTASFRRTDRTDLPLVTIDPEGSRDLDQALHIVARGRSYRVWYAIADVAAFVPAGDAVDEEAWHRGVTFYCPDRRAPLHPPVLGESRASLLAGRVRPALLWRIDLDQHGMPSGSRLQRTMVRSRRAWSYTGAQAALDGGNPPPVLDLLRTVGRLRQAAEVARGGVDLNLPEQAVVTRDGAYELAYRAPLPVEGWNAQISLLAGIEAARIMLDAGVGVLRTLPPPPARALAAIRRSADVLGLPWPRGVRWADFLRDVDRSTPAGAALVTQAARAFRGAGYTAFDGAPPAGDVARHAGVAAHYAHVTAPLRRLVDRYANEVVLAVCDGHLPPDWALERLAALPRTMGRAQQREKSLSRSIVDFVEATVLRHRVGDVFDATVTDVDARGAVLQLQDPAVLTRLEGAAGRTLSLGTTTRVRLTRADPVTRETAFVVV
jgi:exoribonuclease R